MRKIISLKLTARKIFILFSLFFINPISSIAETAQLECAILELAAHNPKSFTQGLVMDGDTFYESSGQYSKSYISKYSSDDPNDEIKMDIPREVFAEGLTLFNSTLYLLSWKKGKAFAIDKDSLSLIKTFNYSGEGWGLTHNSQSLIMSDGSSILRFYNPTTFKIEKTLSVSYNETPLKNINELEFSDGIIWANQWHSDVIYGIDSQSGNVVATMDCSLLRAQSTNDGGRENVLNGIAFDKKRNGVWLTGKYWPYRFLISLPALNQQH